MPRYCVTILLIIFSGELFAQDTACSPIFTIVGSQNNICMGTTVTFHALVTNNGTNGVFKWRKNNSDAGADNSPIYTSSAFHNGDVIRCEYSCKTICGTDTTVVSNSITLVVINDINPVITISNSDSIICEGEPTFFTSQSFYGNAVPFYQWTVNGSPVGTNTPDYSTTTLTNGSLVKCVLTVSSQSCPGTLRSSSSQMTIYVYPMIHPAIKITPSRSKICKGEAVTFTATANGGAYPTFTWEINGKPTGDTGIALITSALKDGDSVSCVVTIDQDSRCHSNTSAPSNGVVIHVQDFTDPTLMIAAPLLNVCAGTTITLTATAQNAGDFKLYQWMVNGRNAGSDSISFSYGQFANGDTVSCGLTTDIPGCFFQARAFSNIEVLTVRDAPVISFSPPEISVMQGEAAKLNASVAGNTASFAWTPAAELLTPQSLQSSTLPLTRDTAFNLTVLDIDGCTASKEIVVKILHKLYIPSGFTPNKDGKNDVFRIPRGADISLREFSVYDRWGNVVFLTTDIAQGWNGTYQGQDLTNGSYVYIIRGIIQNKEVFIRGMVTLIR